MLLYNTSRLSVQQNIISHDFVTRQHLVAVVIMTGKWKSAVTIEKDKMHQDEFRVS